MTTKKGKEELNIETSVKRVSSAKGDSFAKDAANIEETMKKKEAQVKQGLAEAEKEAEKARKAKEAAAKEKAAASKSESTQKHHSSKTSDKELVEDTLKVLQGKGNVSDMEDIASAALSRAATAGSKKKGGFFQGLLLGLVFGLIGAFVLQNIWGIGKLTQQVNTGKESVDAVIDETFLGYTSADFQDAILGNTTAKQDLEVMDQALVLPTTVTKSGLGNLKIFSKVKQCQFAGDGIYTIDMGKMDTEHISYDENTHTVTVKVPHAVLAHVILDEGNTTFDDTDKGLLAFGDLALTEEQHNELTTTIKDQMTQELEKEDLMKMADDYGQKKVWQILNPLVETVDKNVMLEVEFED